MSASNFNWVCFDCRYAKREPKTSRYIPQCLYCKNDLFCLGYKVAIPKRSDIKRWKKIQKDSYILQVECIDSLAKEKVRQKHCIEREIQRLEYLKDTKENRKKIKKLSTYLSTGIYLR